MKTFRQLIELWPSAEQFAQDIGLRYPSHARTMKLRNSIPPDHWAAALSAAKKRGIKLTLADLKKAQKFKARTIRK